MPGTLFVVATPIGNLEDLTFRALRTLREVDLIAAEDTRRTSKLLAHYDIQKPLLSLHEHNEALKSDHLIAKLAAGQNLALVSDAGTPTIADPGYRLVAAARNAGVRVVPIPGVSAVITAISGSGLPADTFTFLGFPPSGGLARDRWFERLATEPGTVAFYESPHRIERTMDDLVEILVNRPCVLCRELTKLNEELVEWPNNNSLRAQGEFVVVVGPGTFEEVAEPEADNVAYFVGQVIEKLSLDESGAMALAATHFSMPAIKVRKLLKKGRILLKRSSDNQLP
jgi:16S rRNA (cytidine1402-2'-O)-methyltransferase